MPRKGGVPENLVPPAKGEVRNPNGKPKGVERILRDAGLDRAQVMQKFSSILSMDVEELEAASQDKSTPALDAIVIKIVLEAIKNGDVYRMDSLLNRIIGKPAERVEQETKEVTRFSSDDAQILQAVEGRKKGSQS